MPNWRKVILSGSNAALNNLTVNDLTVAGTFSGTTGTDDNDWHQTSDGLTLTASKDVQITGSLFVSNNIQSTGDIIANQYIVRSTVTQVTQSFSSGSTIFGDTNNDTHQFTGSILVLHTSSVDQVNNIGLQISGSGLLIDNGEHGKLAMGQHNVGLEIGVAGLSITGSGLIISQSFTNETTHHNMVKIGETELVDISGSITTDSFLVNVRDKALVVSSSALNKPLARIEAGNTAFYGSTTNQKVITISGDNLTLGTDGGGDVVTTIGALIQLNSADVRVRAGNLTPTSTAHLLFTPSNPNSSTAVSNTDSRINSTPLNTSFPFFGGAITASAVSASGDLFASLSLNDTSTFNTVMYDSTSGQFFFTGSYIGEGGGGVADNLGNHIATQDLDMAGNSISASLNITASGNVTASEVRATGFLNAKGKNLINENFSGNNTITIGNNSTILNNVKGLQTSFAGDLSIDGFGPLANGDITASGDISASGLLFVSTSEEPNQSYRVLVQDTTTGRIYHTGSYSVGGGSGGADDDWFQTTDELHLTSSKSVIVTGSITASAGASFLENAVTINGIAGPNSEIFVDGFITASSHISGSGMLFASLSLDSSNFKTVMYDTSSGKFFFTGSYGGGGGGSTGGGNAYTTIKLGDGTTYSDLTATTTTETLQINTGSNISVTSITNGGGTDSFDINAIPTGFDRDVQYNDSGLFGGTGSFTFSEVTKKVIIGNLNPTTQNIFVSNTAEHKGKHHIQDGEALGTNARYQQGRFDIIGLGRGAAGAAAHGLGLDGSTVNTTTIPAPQDLTGNNTTMAGDLTFGNFYGVTDGTTGTTKLIMSGLQVLAGSPSILLEKGTISFLPSESIEYSSDTSGSIITPVASASGRISLTEVAGNDGANSSFDIIGRKNTKFQTGESGSESNYLIYENTTDTVGIGKGITTDLIKNDLSTNKLAVVSGGLSIHGGAAVETNGLSITGSVDTDTLAIKNQGQLNYTPKIRNEVPVNDSSFNRFYFLGTLAREINDSLEFRSFPDNKTEVVDGPDVRGRRGGVFYEFRPTIGGRPDNTTGVNLGVDEVDIITDASDKGRKSGVRILSNPTIEFLDNVPTSSISGTLALSSASAQIKFDTGSSAVKFFAGSRDEDLKEVLHISKSGDNPRIGIGTSNPIRAFDFKEVRDDNRGGEILIRGSRTTKGAENNDEVGRINFAIDSASFGKIDTSGSAAEIVAIVDDIDETGVQGSLSLRVAVAKTTGSIQRIKIDQNGTEFTGSAAFGTDVTIGDDLTVSDFALLNSARIGSTAIDPGDGVLHVEDYGVFVGGLKVGSSEDPGANNLLVDGNTTLNGAITTIGNGTGDTLIISGSNLKIPNLTIGNTSNYDKLLILDSTGRARTLAKSATPFTQILDDGGGVPGDKTLAMFTGSTGEITDAPGITFHPSTGLNLSNVGSTFDLAAGSVFITQAVLGNVTASTGNISVLGNVTASGNISATGNISASGQIIAEAGPTINTTLASDSATNIDTFNTSSNNGAIYDYTLFSAPSGARAGQCMVVHHNGNTDFTDTSTPTLGSEISIPFFETAVNGANVEVKIASGSGYTFKAFVKKL